MHVDLQHSGSGSYCSTQTYRYCTSDQQATQSEFHLAAVVDGEVRSMPLEWRHFLLVAASRLNLDPICCQHACAH
jgi:hypothetical protein